MKGGTKKGKKEMKCTLCGIQDIRFTSQDTGEVVEGVKLHVVSDRKEAGSGMEGQRAAAVFTKLPVGHLKIGSKVDLVYEQILGSNKTRLVAVDMV